ncbi:hypothetical protein KIW84_032458 [Lathyrus oleraceus]|uniref:RCK N-terminal domain-containing protein n=1 Tax=Pisum sativum TaxID=3888 RepID=A0A9D4XUC1_PEA|nr:hypothetical protein KIW84_032458 [Pisum sativum]
MLALIWSLFKDVVLSLFSIFSSIRQVSDHADAQTTSKPHKLAEIGMLTRNAPGPVETFSLGHAKRNSGAPQNAHKPAEIKKEEKLGFPIIYGDGSSPGVLQSAGISSPKAIMIMLTEKKKSVEAVQRLRLAFPAVPIYARARDPKHLLDLKKAGATDATLENAETSLQLGSKLLKGLGMMSDDVAFLSQLVRDSMEQQAELAVSLPDYRETKIMEPLQQYQDLKTKSARERPASAAAPATL